MNIDETTYQIFNSLRSDIFYPATEFMDEEDIINVCENFKIKNSFFPVPLFITAKISDLKLIKDNILNLFHNKRNIGSIKIKKIFTFDKKKIEDLIFKKKFKYHPYKKLLYNQNDFFLNAEPLLKVKNNIKENKSLVGFATRNIPHAGHKKIILDYVKKKKKILVGIFSNSSNIQSLNNSNFILFKYKKFIKKNNLSNKVFLKELSIPGFLLGPRQASLQAIIMKNLGCNAFIVGRDHSGYKNFYKEFESYNFCKKNEKKIGIKILKSGSPFFCKRCNKVMLRNECNCWKVDKKFFFDISSSFIRKVVNNSKLKKKYSYLY